MIEGWGGSAPSCCQDYGTFVANHITPPLKSIEIPSKAAADLLVDFCSKEAFRNT